MCTRQTTSVIIVRLMAAIYGDACGRLVRVELVALDFNKSEPKGRAALQDLEYTPTFVFSLRDKEIGRIVERPVGTLEAAIGSIMGQVK